MKHQELLVESFDKVIKEYELKFIDISANFCLLVGENYALRFMTYGGEIDVDYIDIDLKNYYRIFGIHNYCVSQFDEQDRQGLPAQRVPADMFRNYFMVLSKGLKRHFSYILDGDKNWISDYQNYALAEDISRLEPELEKIIRDFKANN